jgi:drug/metabolite transporter (DMT)-like permease
MHLLMFGATFCWAGNIIAVKEALMGFHSFALTQLRITFAGIIFFVLLWSTGKLRNLKLSRRDWVFMIFIGVTGVTLNQLSFVAGLEYSSASHAGLIVALGPVMVLVLACSIGLEPLTIPKFVGMLVAFGGVVILTTTKSGAESHKAWLGDLILLAGSAFFAAYTILVKEVADKFDALTLNALAYLIGVPLLAPFTLPAVLDVRWEKSLRARGGPSPTPFSSAPLFRI